ncbi:MFS transporter [Streptomonospora wellingtoniae]|uniref:MFS transporter n=1 Tax=Streptomonospora wellingtoniae TaxID=3075544 RepID=A0ABU2KN17_9ACTN|nr:MFS transporter [Streptomonospora sp. DSM 45055]MDT0300655.1 MFS transporter [Streptomonospora sp. DSM 45055]
MSGGRPAGSDDVGITQDRRHQQEQVTAAVRRRAVTAAMIGNATEWYDYATYGYMAVVLGAVFFPQSEPVLSLLASFATFAVAFVVRPVGAFVLGPLNDRIGRKRTLSITILTMAAATCTIGLLPGYEAIGAAAPAALVLVRLVQGFAVGGEYGGASTFVVEYAPDRRRGLWASWLEFGAIGGFLLASGITTYLTYALSDADLHAWGWRIPFLLALPLGSIGLYLRLRLTDTPEFLALTEKAAGASAPIRETFTRHRGRLLLCVAILVYSSVGTYVLLTYLPTYLTQQVGTAPTTAQLLVAVAGGVLTVGIPFAGALSDRVGRRPMLIAAAVGYLALAYPAFWLIRHGGWHGALAGVLVLTACHIPLLGTTTATLPALFPARVRGTGVAVGYNTSFAVFGGTAPLLLTFAVTETEDPSMPAYYLVIAALVAVVAAALMPETAGEPLD